jgi:hypothetical protein
MLCSQFSLSLGAGEKIRNTAAAAAAAAAALSYFFGEK